MTTQVVLSNGRLKGRSILHMGPKPKPEQVDMESEKDIQDRILQKFPPLTPKIRIKSR